MKVNLGSGPRHVEGWVEFDKSPSLLLSKVRVIRSWLRAVDLISENHIIDWDSRITYKNALRVSLRKGSVQYFYISHLLEHLYRDDAERLLDNTFEMLAAGGIIRICSPDYDLILDEYLSSKDDSPLTSANRLEDRLLSHPSSKPRGFTRVSRALSGHTHYWHPFKTQVLRMLENSGFSQCNFLEFRQGELPDLHLIETRESHSFYIEAKK